MTSYNRSTTITLVLLPLFLSWFFAQVKNEPFREEKAGKEYYIQRTIEVPVIDGKLDDPIWSKIIPITDFIQEEPNNMEEPTEKTEVFLTYNDRSLFIAARLYDSDPSKIIHRLSARDDWYGAFADQADWISIDLDSRHDHQTAYSFAVNASGVISDEMIYHDTDYDTDWNANWIAEVNITEIGWIIEIKIPFSNLSFFDREELQWGLNITRFIQRKYETITWVGFPLEVEGIVSKFGHLNGLKGIYPPAKLELLPYSSVGITNYRDIRLPDVDIPINHEEGYMNIPHINMGLDMKYRINTNSILTLAVNPDFGQVESDPANINLTSYETYFPEKRNFFLKDSDIFVTPIELFYSRRIGDNSWGLGMDESISASNGRKDTTYYDITIPVKIKAAGKLTGKNEKGFSYGFLTAVTTESDSSTWHSYFDPDSIYRPYKYPKAYFVSRVKQDFFSGNSFLGLMTTSTEEESGRIVSIDGMLNLLDNQIRIDGQMVMNSDNKRGVLGNITYSPLGYFSTWIDYQKYETGLELNHLGYLWRDNYSQIKAGIKFQNQVPWRLIRSSAIILEGDIEENSDGLDIGKTLELSYDVMFSNFWQIGGGFYKDLEYYDDRKTFDFYSSDFGPIIKIPEINGYHFQISSDKHQKLSASLSWTHATNTRGDIERDQFFELVYRPNTYLTFSGSYDRYRLIKKYKWLEVLPDDADENHYIFSNFNKRMNIFSFRASGNIGRDIYLQLYSEIFQNYDVYSNYSEYIEDPLLSNYGTYYGDNESEGTTSFMENKIYTTVIDEIQSTDLVLDPNYYILLFPKYTSFVFNGVLKWNYIQGSNLYIVYTARKSVNGKKFNNIDELQYFFTYNEREKWVQVLRDQSIMIKLDYWFEI